MRIGLHLCSAPSPFQLTEVLRGCFLDFDPIYTEIGFDGKHEWYGEVAKADVVIVYLSTNCESNDQEKEKFSRAKTIIKACAETGVRCCVIGPTLNVELVRFLSQSKPQVSLHSGL
jgi:hypothetical protein